MRDCLIVAADLGIGPDQLQSAAYSEIMAKSPRGVRNFQWSYFMDFACRFCSVILCFLAFLTAQKAYAINITVDYRYDLINFFNTNTTDGQQARAAVEAAADRFSTIITTSLGAVSLTDNFWDERIGFTHPGTGGSWDVSSAASQATDSLASDPNNAAEEYRGPWSIDADEWILYVGARPLSSAGLGGTGTGLNYTNVFEDEDSVLNRGFRTTSDFGDLPVWGGAITFDSDGSTNWHFDHTSAAPLGETDFYSIAMHEIGHVLGLSTSWDDWEQNSSGGVFTGPNAVAAYNADNGTSVTSLNEQGPTNPHWQDGAYDSKIFEGGNPNTVGTVGLGNLQDLLMEPIANFVYPSLRRLELTNVDVAALEDVGWSVISAPTFSPADFDTDGDVDNADLAIWQTNFGSSALADANGDGRSDGLDFLVWQDQFTGDLSTTIALVPEPSSAILMLLGLVAGYVRRR